MASIRRWCLQKHVSMYFLLYTEYCGFLLWEQSLAKLQCSCMCCLPTRLKGMQSGSPIPGNSDHRVSEVDLWTQSIQMANRTETQLGLVPKKTSRTWTHTMGEGEREKSSKNKLRRQKRQAEKLAPHWLDPTWMCVRDKAWERKVSLDLPGKGALIYWLTGKAMAETKSSDSHEWGNGFGSCIK